MCRFFICDYPDSALTFPANAREETIHKIHAGMHDGGVTMDRDLNPRLPWGVPCCGYASAAEAAFAPEKLTLLE
jgi:hypothetical protein